MTNYQKITFVIPCRNNLQYLKQAVESIEKHYGDYHHIILLDDASTDGTWEWIKSLDKPYITPYRNEGKERVGHTVLYDIGFKLTETPVVSILHSDMVVTPNYVQNMLKHLTPLSVVSATRIEPPLHPPGPEKFVFNFGFDVDEFKEVEDKFLEFVKEQEWLAKDQKTQGIFAPWMMYKEDFSSIGGHDLLFAPMELEDSDIFNRFHLSGYNLIQSRDSFVYHMTCRGSRFKDGLEIERVIDLPDGTKWYKPKDSVEYTLLRQNKFREWWRKWHTNVLHDQFMYPQVPKRYETSFVIKNCNENILRALEPWCDNMYVDCEYFNYVETENPESLFDISSKIHHITETPADDVVIKFDGTRLTQELYNEFITKIPFIIEETDSTGSFEWEIFEVIINKISPKDMILPFFKNVF